MSVSDAVRTEVRSRARGTCEYGRLPEHVSSLPHQVDHIVAIQHGGPDSIDNLCLACIRCNLKKGPNIASTDPLVGASEVVRLFDPRHQPWREHFRLCADGTIEGTTPIGRATSSLLGFNAAERVRLRVALVRTGWRLG